MKVISNVLEIEIPKIPLPFDIDKTIFLDIETTGFTAKTASIYLIGIIFYDSCNNAWNTTQFLNDDGNEQTILEEFFKKISSYKNLVHFNGNHFDLPFILARASTHSIDASFDKYNSYDLYRECSLYKQLFKTADLKQKTLENFFGLHRKDIYSGGELINFYHEYRKNFSKKTEDLLLLHNREDLQGMLSLLSVYTYTHILNGHFQLDHYEFQTHTDFQNITHHEFMLVLQTSFQVPKRVSLRTETGYFTMFDNTCKLLIPAYCGELKFFYSNYKDYYYLPAEDMALHKSVASYVEKKHRTQAKASTCYARKTSTFIPFFDHFNTISFMKNYGDSIHYMEANEDFLKDTITLNRYAHHMLQSILHNK